MQDFVFFCRRAGSTVNADTNATSPKNSFKLRCAETRVSAHRPEIDTPVAGKQAAKAEQPLEPEAPFFFSAFFIPSRD